MPSERFRNLPLEKRERIIHAAVKEFVRVPVEEVSINQIIKDAEISRGSFYQYFEDKRDLEQFILKDFAKHLHEGAEEYIKERRGNIFAIFYDALEKVIEAAKDPHCKDICANVFSQMKFRDIYDTSSIFKKQDKEFFMELIFQYPENQNLADEMRIAVDMLFVVLIQAIANVFKNQEEKNNIIEDYHKKVALVEKGYTEETRNAKV